MLRFLIAGFGSIGKRHFDNLKQIENVKVNVLTRRHLDLPGSKVYFSLEEAFAEHFDAVFITNETALHIPTAIAFAERGYHLFIEKPLSDSLKDVPKLTELVSTHSLKVMVGCNMRFHPVVSLVNKLVRENRIGRIVSARIEAGEYLPDWHPGRDYRNSYSARRELGGGVILDFIHELDYARWFFGEASRIFCFSGKRSDLELETEDTAEILIEFENGTLCEVHLDYVQRPPSRNIRLVGAGGAIWADLITSKVGIFDSTANGWEVIDLKEGLERNKMYQDEVKHFIDYLSGSSLEPPVGLDDGIKVLQMALAAKESSLEERVINISKATRRSS